MDAIMNALNKALTAGVPPDAVLVGLDELLRPKPPDPIDVLIKEVAGDS